MKVEMNGAGGLVITPETDFESLWIEKKFYVRPEEKLHVENWPQNRIYLEVVKKQVEEEQ